MQGVGEATTRDLRASVGEAVAGEINAEAFLKFVQAAGRLVSGGGGVT
jgi:hypothetical protein